MTVFQRLLMAFLCQFSPLFLALLIKNKPSPMDCYPTCYWQQTKVSWWCIFQFCHISHQQWCSSTQETVKNKRMHTSECSKSVKHCELTASLFLFCAADNGNSSFIRVSCRIPLFLCAVWATVDGVKNLTPTEANRKDAVIKLYIWGAVHTLKLTQRASAWHKKKTEQTHNSSLNCQPVAKSQSYKVPDLG